MSSPRTTSPPPSSRQNARRSTPRGPPTWQRPAPSVTTPLQKWRALGRGSWLVKECLKSCDSLIL
eukprot:6619874-Prymnesium_polylepis.1